MGFKSKKNKADANMAVEVSGNRVFGSGNKLITDERFAPSQKDPRFQDVARHKTKVTIDSRFSRMFTDKNFSTSSARVDKRGRSKQDGDSSQTALRHYYRMDDHEKKQNSEYERDDAAKSKSGPESESETETETESLGEEDFVDDGYTSADAYLEEETTLKENVPDIDIETHRLAIVDMDWNQVQAVDLLVLLSSFLPITGQILSVSIYPSESGLKGMKKEAVYGPVGLFDDEDPKNKIRDDNEKLRDYELKRLRDYFAVVVCDSQTLCSLNIIHVMLPPRLQQTRALQLSKVDLTWDENEPRRSKKLKRKINVHQESEYVKDEQELKEFIASSESESEEDDKNHRKRQKTDAYRALLQSGDEDEDEEDNGMEMEVTFNTGLENNIA